MKIAAIVFALFLTLPGKVYAAETDQDVNKALAEFDKFHRAHPYEMQITAREAVGKPWAARIYEVRLGNLVAWEEEGYPTLMQAVKAVEKDYVKHPGGYKGTHK